MPFRLRAEGHPDRTKIQFTTNVEMPNMVYRACVATGVVSNTVYVQHAVCEALARDLGIPLDDLIEMLPPPRGPASHLYDPENGHPMDRYRHRTIPTGQLNGGVVRVGPANTDEEVR
jgi:hypothetical protein